MKGLIIIDFSRTLYDKDAKSMHPGAVEFLEKYGKSYALALISRERESSARIALIKQLGIEHHFEIVIVRERKGLDEFKEAMEKTGFGSDKAWSIGDKIKTEIAVGRQLGIKTIWFRHGKYANVLPEHEGEEPDYIVGSWKEVEEIIPT